MYYTKLNYLVIFSCFLFFIQSLVLKSQTFKLKREFRGAYIATVSNIDWPSDKNLSSEKQKTELIDILDKLKAAGINAVIFQIRTECDALYNSSIEPWSYWLTGKQGRAPEPFYDPLEFVITEAHKRAMELHAWLNPYRAVKNNNSYPLAGNHVTNQHPGWILKFGELKILNPGVPEVEKYILNIVKDVVERYDIDGIHFDDYFYPYTPVKNEDSLTFKIYQSNFTNIQDWRRNNINNLISDVYQLINSINPKVKFGVSPFGIIENKYAGTKGFESYKVLYCDPLYWIDKKIIDYISPQLYWEIGHKSTDYGKLLPWWSSVKDSRHLYIGHFSSRIADENYSGKKSELGDQLRMNYQIQNVNGDIFFSAKSIVNNYSGLADSMKFFWYEFPALLPEMNWKDSIPPLAPVNLKSEKIIDGIKLKWSEPDSARDGEYPRYYLIYCFKEDEDINLGDPTKIINLIPAVQTIYIDKRLYSGKRGNIYIVSSLDRLWNESRQFSITKIDK
jgi:uncharacterized lipoprotein YddW (UPF0748 family)